MCAQGLGRSFQNQCFFWLWSPAGSQAIDRVVFGLQWVADPLLWVCARGQPATDPRLRTHSRFKVWAPSRGFRCARPPRRFLSVRPGNRAASQGMRPPGVSGVGPRPLLGVRAHWGTLGLAPRQPGRLSGCTLTRNFSCGPPVDNLGASQQGFR